MSVLKELNAVLRLYESNFRNLHWNARGKEFNDSHKSITTEYYEMIGDTIDQVAEMMIMLGEHDVPNYIETVKIIEESDKQYCTIDSRKLYDRDSIIKVSDVMLGDICELLVKVLKDDKLEEDINAGIKSEFETILYQYTLQHRYINKRRME